MKTNKEDPCGYVQAGYTGLTKREYFAAMAMQGILANSYALKRLVEGAPMETPTQVAILMADKLIAALNKEVQGE